MLGRGQANAGEAVPGESIHQGEWIAPFAVEGFELAFEVGRPDRVGVRHGGQSQARMAWMWAPAPWLHQAVLFEELCRGGTSGEGQGWSLSVKDAQYLRWSPAQVLA